MPTIEMFVSLKVPDNVAITAFNALKRMGYDKLIALERSDYYKFDVSGDEKKFKDEISKVDIVVNANKHKFSFSTEKNKDNKDSIVNVLVQDFDNGSGLLSVLKERLGIKSIKNAEKGVLWTMHLNKDADAEKIAGDIAKNLLMNESYQKFKFLK